jgi:hypothetical protein
MSAGRTQQQVMQREYLPVRAKILEIAAALDRIDRADSSLAESDPLREQLQQAIGLLLEHEGGRAKRVQKIFSLPYDKDWQQAFGLTRP